MAKGETWCDQVKDVPWRGPWTLRSAAALLNAAASHLAAGRKVRLVLSTGSPALRDLADRARAAVTLAEFEQILAGPQGDDFTVLCGVWADDGKPVDRETLWRYLQSVYVKDYSPENLRELVHITYEQLFVGNPEGIVRQLSGYLDDNLHKWLTGSEIRNHLLSLDGVRLRLLAGDSNTLNALAATKDGFLRHVRGTTPAFGLAVRPHLDQLHGRLVAEDGPQIVLCEGRAGSGKSTVAADVLERLAGDGWPIAVVRRDRADPSVRTARDLGAMMNLQDSPGILLPGVADGGPGLFVVDQLDAVSLYSGRMADVFEAVEDVLAQLSAAPKAPYHQTFLLAALTGLDRLEGESAEKPDMRPAAGPGPLAPDQVVKVRRGRREKRSKCSSRSYWLPRYPRTRSRGCLASATGSTSAIRRSATGKSRRCAPGVGSRAASQTVVWGTRRHTLSVRNLRSLSEITVGVFLRTVYRVISSAWPWRSHVWPSVPHGGGVASVDRPAPLQEKDVDVRAAAVEGVGSARVVAGLDQIAVGLKEDDLVTAVEERVDQEAAVAAGVPPTFLRCPSNGLTERCSRVEA
ncbi:hypothetical protein [Streptomyces sp. NPDC058955]|uniref:hypothetical protein n=1 Tax=unclassified Streptomyces TaxID=2593676 RepID=UPI00364F6F7A